MSAFAVIYERSEVPIEMGMLMRVMDPLKHRGPDGSDVVISGNVALGHWHFWTTPEEVGERQPLDLNELPFKIVLDGRLDNREELFKKLDIKPVEGVSLSDAVLMLRAYACWGEACLEHFVGEYAFVIFDVSRNQLLCARDAMGERTLFYAWQGTRLVIASEARAVASALNLQFEFNETWLARYFAMKTNEDGQTIFKNVCEFLPAYGMSVTGTDSRLWRYWRPDRIRKIRGRSDEEYAAGFLALLEESVRCRMRSNLRLGVSLSGGLDSGSITCLAARMLAPQPLTTLSYIFDEDELADCDESDYIETIKEKWKIRSIQFPGDNAWPFKDWPLNPNRPCGNPFQLLIELLYRSTHQEGLGVLLTGGGGDHLYNTGVNWFADLISEGYLLQAWRELLYHVRYYGLRKTIRAGFLQRTGRRLLDFIPFGRHLYRRSPLPAWLTPLSRELLQKGKNKPDPIIRDYISLLGMGVASNHSDASIYASRYAVELRHPYRDRRLVEFVMSLPSYQLYNHGLYKHILRTAMMGILPDAIRTRRRPTTHNSLFIRGLKREKTFLQASFENTEAAWRRFISPDWVLRNWKITLESANLRLEDMSLWACIAFEAWYISFV